MPHPDPDRVKRETNQIFSNISRNNPTWMDEIMQACILRGYEMRVEDEHRVKVNAESKKKGEDPAPLTPPDPKRCQAEKLSGSFMTLGPRHMERCGNAPTVIVTEKAKDEFGRQGSMSLCQECLAVLIKRDGADHFTSAPISATHAGET